MLIRRNALDTSDYTPEQRSVVTDMVRGLMEEVGPDVDGLEDMDLEEMLDHLDD